jgi:hypothetical protein
MRFSRILGLVWTLGVFTALVVILKLRLGYDAALEPGLVWVIEAIFTLFVLWSIGVLLFSATTALIAQVHTYFNPARTLENPNVTLANSPIRKSSSLNVGARQTEVSSSTFECSVKPGDTPYFWLNYEYALRGDAEGRLNGTIWQAFLKMPGEDEKLLQAADISSLRQMSTNSYVLNRNLYLALPETGGMTTFRVVARVRCTSSGSFTSRFAIFPYLSSRSSEGSSESGDHLQGATKLSTSLFPRRSFAAVDALLYGKSSSAGADRSTENYWTAGAVRLDDPPKDVDYTEEYVYRIRMLA